jgi:hypothetical protein
MGNNQPNFHKRERTSDGSQRSRAHSGNNLPLPLSAASVNTSAEDCPVQMKIKEEFDPSMDFLEGKCLAFFKI